MKIPSELLDDIRARVPVSHVVRQHVKLSRAGREMRGLSPFNRERTPSFYVNDAKQRWFDFSANRHGDIIDFVMEIEGRSFKDTVVYLAGLAGVALPADIHVRERSQEDMDEARARQERREAERKRWLEEREREEELDEEKTRAIAGRIWSETIPLAGSAAERYLVARGLPRPDECPDPDKVRAGLASLRSHPALKHPSGKTFPALVGRVDDMAGELTAVWRIYVTDDGKKAPVGQDVKLGLGPAAGGAVRIGGIAECIGVAEGIESALGAWFLVRCRVPVWATLSTSGMQNFEPPLDVKRVRIFPDSDYPKRDKATGELARQPTPAGRKAAAALHRRCLMASVECAIEPETRAGSDYLDIWNACKARIAA